MDRIRPSGTIVTVYLDGQARQVRTCYGSCWRAARSALGVPQGTAFALEAGDREPIDARVLVFHAGDRFVTISHGNDDEPTRDSWERDPDWWRAGDAER